MADDYFYKKSLLQLRIEKKCHPPASLIEKFGLGTVITILCDLRNVNFFGLFFLNKIYKKLFFDLLIFFIYD